MHTSLDTLSLILVFVIGLAVVVWAWYSALKIDFLEQENTLLRQSLIKLTLNQAVTTNKDSL